MRHFQRSSLTAVAAILAAVSVRAAAPSTDIPANVDAVAKAEITASALRAPVRFLASDELEGRGPATRGDALARLYLSAQLETLGYQPGGDLRPADIQRKHRSPQRDTSTTNAR